MSDELDLTEIDALLDDPRWTLDELLVRHLYQMRAEVGRLRALLTTEHAKTTHARAWAQEWRNNAIGDLADTIDQTPPDFASDGWSVRAPTEDEVNDYYATHAMRFTPEELRERIEEQAYEDSK